MEIEISTSDSAEVNPAEIAALLTAEGFYVRSVSVNEQERYWQEPA